MFELFSKDYSSITSLVMHTSISDEEKLVDLMVEKGMYEFRRLPKAKYKADYFTQQPGVQSKVVKNIKKPKETGLAKVKSSDKGKWDTLEPEEKQYIDQLENRDLLN
mmetsp:Transcript_17610/g.16840  ORF Transcript_17610/g.16840 Transcript_17610/m.16840 type:complete len:107 (+) Transcript_17610:656-976(+)|eukprot:CAMPEP_0170563920 /NCGR_PEP_ID=MMETSP0211-20121228/69802_1 /TAXON_ID=311385 /ORGANISM="Pseudokeronopsis sp., Strain OXSARD2" /LENGTH=106 /DNA_ID=CAMNT_0010882761 /DNA_START=587 /DNA_END=907 /DNA_ORIENTATION=-